MKVVNSQWSVVSKNLFCFALCAFLFALCDPLEAQQSPRTPQIGYLTLRASPSETDEAFLEAFRKLGYIDGQNIKIQYRWAAGKVENLPQSAEELVRMQVDIIVAASTPAIQAAKKATKTIPIVMTGSADPVGTGLIASLAHPGGNVYGPVQHAARVSRKKVGAAQGYRAKALKCGFLGPWRRPRAPAFREGGSGGGRETQDSDSTRSRRRFQ
jgi:ABC-type uncharacterized transport system substrate-binding protein